LSTLTSSVAILVALLLLLSFILRARRRPACGPERFLDLYLSSRARDNIAEGCAMAAFASEIGRQGEAFSATFTDGFAKHAGAIERVLSGSAPERQGWRCR
jgi:hypothetical protein